MAVVLSSEDSNYFSTGSSLRRSHSQRNFMPATSVLHNSASTSQLQKGYRPQIKIFSDSAPSSAPSSPGTPHAAPADDVSWLSTPETDVSLSTDGDVDDEEQDELALPDYGTQFFDPPDDLEPPPSSRTATETNTPASISETTAIGEHAADDTAIGATPSRHVDYLSHEWREEDVWSSWKYVVSNKSDFSNAARLENASWRSWMKAKNNLKTISAETLDWLKDCDVTWLYGPLQPGRASPMRTQNASSAADISESSSFLVGKKPILKKRSMSEIMLQKYISSSSLVKQAAAAVQAQQQEGPRRGAMRPRLGRATTDYVAFPYSSQRASACETSALTSIPSSGLATPGGERRHIHFNEQVEQCIAIEAKGFEDDAIDSDRRQYGSDSDDGAFMMKRTASKRRRPILKSKTTGSKPAESKTIVKLPSTTLKYREDTPEPPETAMKHSTGWKSPVLTPSSSQETLRPSRASGSLFFVDDEMDDNTSTSRSSSGLRKDISSNSLGAEPGPGMRRTESGMFMPYDDSSPPGSDGVFGLVADTVNTARDIAHVIWNVGWRR